MVVRIILENSEPKISNFVFGGGEFQIGGVVQSDTIDSSNTSKTLEPSSILNTASSQDSKSVGGMVKSKDGNDWGEIVSVLFQDDIKSLKKSKKFPLELELRLDDSDIIERNGSEEVFVNRNRDYSSESD